MHRLAALAAEVENGQPAMSKRDAGGGIVPGSGVVRSPVGEAGGHLPGADFERLRCTRPFPRLPETDDTAHISSSSTNLTRYGPASSCRHQRAQSLACTVLPLSSSIAATIAWTSNFRRLASAAAYPIATRGSFSLKSSSMFRARASSAPIGTTRPV